MRTYRQIFALITLFCLFFELCEPSTNFIRTSPGAQKQEQVLKIHFQVDGSGASQDQDQDHGPSILNFETHAAQIAVTVHFELEAFYSPIYLNNHSDTVRGGYSRSIFQPPKAA